MHSNSKSETTAPMATGQLNFMEPVEISQISTAREAYGGVIDGW